MVKLVRRQETRLWKINGLARDQWQNYVSSHTPVEHQMTLIFASKN